MNKMKCTKGIDLLVKEALKDSKPSVIEPKKRPPQDAAAGRWNDEEHFAFIKGLISCRKTPHKKNSATDTWEKLAHGSEGSSYPDLSPNSHPRTEIL